MFVSEMFDQLRDLLNDATDTQVPFATKKLYLNRGIARLWPKIYRIATESLTTVEGERNYNLTNGGGPSDGWIASVEITDANGDYQRFTDYDILPGDEDRVAVMVLTGILPAAGRTIRLRFGTFISPITAASYAAAQAETWVGPDRAIHLPVLYAMGMIASRRLDDRQDHTRYSTTQNANGVTDTDIMQSQQLWLGQFELELDAMYQPYPVAKD